MANKGKTKTEKVLNDPVAAVDKELKGKGTKTGKVFNDPVGAVDKELKGKRKK